MVINKKKKRESREKKHPQDIDPSIHLIPDPFQLPPSPPPPPRLPFQVQASLPSNAEREGTRAPQPDARCQMLLKIKKKREEKRKEAVAIAISKRQTQSLKAVTQWYNHPLTGHFVHRVRNGRTAMKRKRQPADKKPVPYLSSLPIFLHTSWISTGQAHHTVPGVI